MPKHILGDKEFISIDQNKCNKCGLCIQVCIVNLWRKINNKITISIEYKERCLECGACYQVCQPDAINFQYPKGGTGIIYEKG